MTTKSKKMKRREFLTAGAAGAVAGGVAAANFPTPAISQGLLRLNMVTTWPKNFPGLGTSPERVAQRVKTATDGRIEIKVFAAGELVAPFDSFDAVSQGNADIYNAAEYYWQGKSKAFNFFSSVPFGMTAPELNAWMYHGGGQELWDELTAQFNLKSFLSANTGVQWGGWFNKEINSPEDLKGLKIRMPGLGGEVLRRLGAAAVTLPGGEIFPALTSGAIDATEWVGPWNDLAFGFYQAAKFYYWPGFHEPGSGLSTTFNLDVWNSLSPGDQALMEAVLMAENNYTYAEFTYNNSAALHTLVNEHNVQLREFPPEVFAAYRKASQEVIEEVAAEDPFTGRVYDSFRKALAITGDVFRFGEAAYLSRR